MSELNDKSSLREEPAVRDELVFFGAITASLCHELKNVFATIGELSGLMSDLGCASGSTGRLSPEKIQSLCGRISRQVDRGEEYSRLLSRFAHSVDDVVAERVNLNDLVVESVDLCRRFGYLQQVTMECSVPDDPVVATLDPFACRYSIFLGIRLALRSADERRAVTISLETGDSGPRNAVASAVPFDSASAQSAELTALESTLSQLGGSTSWVSEPGRDRVVFVLNRA